MAAYSEFGLRVQASRHELLSQLVTRVVGVQPGDENHALALDFALQHAYYHSHGDPNPSHVADFYDGVERRLRDDSQTAKAAALRALQRRALQLPRPRDGSRDHPWPLLAMLAALTGRPLESAFKETPELLGLLYSQQPAPQATTAAARGSPLRRQWRRPAAPPRRRWSSSSGGGDGGGGSGDEECEADPYGAASDLSDWSADAEDGGGDGSAARDEWALRCGAARWQQQQPGQPWSVGGGGGEAGPGSPAWLGGPAAPVAPAAELSARRAAPRPHDLLALLGASRLRAAPWLAPDPARCHPQRTLAAAALAALQGAPAEGFVLDAATGGLAVDARVTTPSLSPGALHALLRDFAEAGSAARSLLHLSRLLSCGDAAGAPGAAPFGFPVTPCLRAFGAALGEQLAAQGAQLAALQLRAGAAAGRGGGDADDAGALAAARRAADGAIGRLWLLRSVVDGALAEIGGPPAQASAALLDCLYRRLASGDPAPSGPAGEGAAGALLHLLLSSLMPLLGALGRWLYGGREGEDCGGGGEGDEGDFFVARAEQLPAQDPRFWSQAFALAAGGGGDARDGGGAGAVGGAGCGVACPSFLAPLAGDILSAGKSLRLLRYMQQEELAAAPLQMRLPEADGGGGHDEPGWFRRGGGGGSGGGGAGGSAPGADAARRGRRRGWSERWAAPGGPRAAGASAAAAAGGGGSPGAGAAAGPVRMSAAARLQLAVAAAAAAHGEDGEAFQLRFAEDACELLRQWDGALPRPGGRCGCGGADGGSGGGGGSREVSPPPQLLQLLPGGGGGGLPQGDGGGGGGGAWERNGAAAGPHQQQRGMLLAMERAGRALRCPGGPLERGGSPRGAAGALLCGEPAPAPEVRRGRIAAATEAAPAAAAPVVLLAAVADADGAAGPADALGLACGVETLSAWGAQLRRDMAAADLRLARLVPSGDAAGGAAAGSLGFLRLGGGGDSDGDDAAAAAGAAEGPAEWPPGLWPLRSNAAGAAGARWLDAPLRPQRRLAWLLSAPPRYVGPIQMLLERALIEPLQDRIGAIGSQLLGCLLGEWGLQAELRAVAGVYLLASPLAVDWADWLLAAVEAGGGLEALDATELTIRLGELAAAAPGEDPLPSPGSLVVSIDAAALDAARAAAAKAGGGPRRGPGVGELAALQVRHLGSWLLSLVADPASLQRFNGCLTLLLQLRWARRELDAARLRAAKSRAAASDMAALDASERADAASAAAARARGLASLGGGGGGAAAAPSGGAAAAGAAAVAAAARWLSVAGEHLLLLEMGHLVSALQGYVMDRLVHGAWARLEQALSAAASLDEVRAAAAAFQEECLRRCCAGAGRGGGATWRHIGASLLQLLDTALSACRAHGQLLELRAQRRERERARVPAGGARDWQRPGDAAAGGMAAAAAAAAALEAAALRGELAAAAAAWRGGRSYLLRILRNRALQLGGDDDVDALLGALCCGDDAAGGAE
ncbi:hypothetical protein Rsub_11359 [Raphidocelis subcapitata]|uniref:Gamma tubulin complex component C-terminal domain-containing protein n=1 Tax=Raphidocelis subcapitata TaxID=307507 RepID=A0A2V0PN11_9CHLO|nr:hypothetical protein Rsub_11359 [Raphidocelis subcapitata]|eukprot:GBF98777.1 hypothetical protein Rsub_11359 [Raphidocelis subcapitata]